MWSSASESLPPDSPARGGRREWLQGRGGKGCKRLQGRGVGRAKEHAVAALEHREVVHRLPHLRPAIQPRQLLPICQLALPRQLLPPGRRAPPPRAPQGATRQGPAAPSSWADGLRAAEAWADRLRAAEAGGLRAAEASATALRVASADQFRAPVSPPRRRALPLPPPGAPPRLPSHGSASGCRWSRQRRGARRWELVPPLEPLEPSKYPLGPLGPTPGSARAPPPPPPPPQRREAPGRGGQAR